MMPHKRPPWIVLSVSVVLLMGASAALAGVAEPKITTDRTIDTSSPDAIVAALLKDKKPAQDKALALFEFQRRMVYHVNADMFGDHRDFMKSFNVYGCNLCGSQATTAVELARAMKCFEEARVVSIPGHTIYELKYDGKWHTFDTMMNFYVFTDDQKTDIANLDELKANPKLALDGVKDGRACPGYLLCGDEPKGFTGGRSGHGTSAKSWSTSTSCGHPTSWSSTASWPWKAGDPPATSSTRPASSSPARTASRWTPWWPP